MPKKTLFFRPDGQPRLLVQRVLFYPNKVVRKPFRRIVIRKNGLVRPLFRKWVASSYGSTDVGVDIAAEEAVIPKMAVLQSLVTLEENAAAWHHNKVPEVQLSSDEMLRFMLQAKEKGIILSLGHDNYTKIQGGVQLCIRREVQLAVQRGVKYLNLHPWQPYPRLAHLKDDPDPFVALVLDGSSLGACRMSHFTAAAREAAQQDIKFNVTMHQLLGHNTELVTELVKASQAKNVLFWLHDYFSLCPNQRLTRNNMAFCNAPDVSSNSCSLCIYGTERPSHMERMGALFEALCPTVVSPSEVTLETWSDRTNYTSGPKIILPHITLGWQPRLNQGSSKANGKIRVGFLGTAEPFKGWLEFERLSATPELAMQFEFFALTASKVSFNGTKVAVQVTEENPNAMAKAVEAQELDIVLHWPDCPETFALTAFEALEGGAYLVTNSASGNVAAAVQSLNRGVVLSDEGRLAEFFINGGARDLAQAARQNRAQNSVNRQHSALSLALFEDMN